MESIAIITLRNKLKEINIGIKSCKKKDGDSIKTLNHIKNELEKAIAILEPCGGEMTKQGFGQLTIPVVIKSVCSFIEDSRYTAPTCLICGKSKWEH